MREGGGGVGGRQWRGGDWGWVGGRGERRGDELVTPLVCEALGVWGIAKSGLSARKSGSGGGVP